MGHSGKMVFKAVSYLFFLHLKIEFLIFFQGSFNRSSKYDEQQPPMGNAASRMAQ